jgi:hypothetical protein
MIPFILCRLPLGILPFMCIVIYGSGEKITHLCDLLPEPRKEVRQELRQDVAVGYKYHSFQLYHCDVWTWGGEYVLFNGTKYWKVPEEAFVELAGKSTSDLGKPFFYRFPPGLLILGGIVVAWICGNLLVRAKDRSKRLMHDPRYQEALRILAEEVKKADPDVSAPEPQREAAFDHGLAAAVNYLQGQGVPPHEAEANLKVILKSFGSIVT